MKVDLQNCSFFIRKNELWEHTTGDGSLSISNVGVFYILYDFWEQSLGNDIPNVPFNGMDLFDDRYYMGRPILSCKKGQQRKAIAYIPFDYNETIPTRDICLLFNLLTMPVLS